MNLNQIGQIALPIQDMERATAFYRDVLGMRFLFQAPPGLAFFDCGGVRLMLAMPEGNSPATGSVIYYTVPNIMKTYEGLCGRGVTFEGRPHIIAKIRNMEIWMAFFRDSEGNFLALMSEVRI